jgi:hypothetical protein
MQKLFEHWQGFLKEANEEDEGNVYSVDFPGLAKEKEEIEDKPEPLDSGLKKTVAKLFFNKHYAKDEETFNATTEALKKIHKAWRKQDNEEALNFLTSLTMAHGELVETQNMYRLFMQQLEDEGLLE